MMKIALIEDEKPNMRMLTDMLRKLRPDWEVVAQLESVRQSVTFFSGGVQPDLVLMDIQLPFLDCVMACSALIMRLIKTC